MANKHEKMLNITHYQRNANQNHNLTPVRMAAIKGLQIINAGEGAEKRECRLVQPLWRTVWRFLKNWKQNCHTTQQSHFWAYTLRKPGLKEIFLWFMSESVLPMFSSKSFISSGLTFRSLIHFEFIFVYGVRKCSSFTLLSVVDQFSQHHLLKRMWRKGNPLTLLVGMQTSTATMENCVEIP